MCKRRGLARHTLPVESSIIGHSSSDWRMLLRARRTREADISHYGCVTGSWVAQLGYRWHVCFRRPGSHLQLAYSPRPSLPSGENTISWCCFLCFAHVPHHSLFAFAFSTQIPKSGKLGAKVINNRTSTRVIVAMHLLTFCFLAWVQRVLGRTP